MDQRKHCPEWAARAPDLQSALASGIETKRESFTQVDEINAEDTTDFRFRDVEDK